MAVNIRPASFPDVPALVALMQAFYEEAGFALPASPATGALEALLAAPHLGAVWVAERSGEAVGHLVLTVAFSMEYGGLRGFVDDLFVAPSFRTRGLASEALSVVRQTCEERGVRALLVETSLANEQAVRVYRRAGFTETGRLLLSMPLATPVHEADRDA